MVSRYLSPVKKTRKLKTETVFQFFRFPIGGLDYIYIIINDQPKYNDHGSMSTI
jgi:hypothetical protein